jgi:hypothetical protein
MLNPDKRLPYGYGLISEALVLDRLVHADSPYLES